jgi:hypothetical protein
LHQYFLLNSIALVLIITLSSRKGVKLVAIREAGIQISNFQLIHTYIL